MENKFLKYIESEDENTSLSELEKKQARNLFSIIKSSISNLQTSSCEHDIEDICAFVEGSSKNREIIEDQIFSCDSCFETYTFLKKEINTINNLTPQYFKDKVYQKDEKNLRKNTIWYILKNNKLLKYSSGALAATFLLFFTINPLNTDMSDFHKSQETQLEDISAPAPAADSNIQSEQSKIKEDKSINDGVQSKPSFNQEIKTGSPPIIKERTISPSVVAPKPKISTDKKISQATNTDSKSKKLSANFSLPSQSRTSSEKSDNSTLTKPTKKAVVNNPLGRRNATIEEPKSNIDSDTTTAPRVEITQPSILQAPARTETTENQPGSNFETSNGNEHESNQDILKKEEAKNAVPAAPVQKDIKDQYNENKAESIETLKQKAVPKPQLRLKDNSKKISINFQIKEKGFVIIKDQNNKVIGKSSLLNVGSYNNFVLEIENTSEDYFQYIYIDSNNNGFFDLEDKLSP